LKISFFRVALKNLRRKKFRSLSLVVAAALACGLIFGAAIILRAVQGGLEKGMARLGADIMVVPAGYESKAGKVLLGGEPSAFYMKDANLAKVKGIAGVEQVSPQLFVTSQLLICCTMPTVLIVGFDPATDFAVTPWIDYRRKEKNDKVDYITVGTNTSYAQEHMHISFFGKRFKIGAIARKTGIKFLDFSAFMPMDVARDMVRISQTESPQPLKIAPDEISSILVKIEPRQEASEVAVAIEQAVPGVKAIVTRELVTSVRRQVRGGMSGVMAMGVASWLMTVSLMALIFTMIINERQREIGLLKAMGATRNHLLRLIAYEAAILAALGGLIGVAAGLAVITRSREKIIAMVGEASIIWPSPMAFGLIGAASLLAIVLSCTVAVLYPAASFSRREPYETIRQGG